MWYILAFFNRTLDLFISIFVFYSLKLHLEKN